MDPISATSIAAFAIQVVDFSAKVIAKTVSISRSGGLVDNEKLHVTAEDLSTVSQKLQKSLELKPGETIGISDNRAAILSLGKECQDAAAELLEALAKLKGRANQNTWRNFRQALSQVWRSEKLEELEHRLDRFRQQLILRLLESLREQLQTQYDAVSASGATIGREIGKYFIQHLEDTEKLHQRLVQDIEKKLLEAIRSREVESNVVLNPPKDRFQFLSSRLLDKLKFQELVQRQERIPEAFAKTFEWIYREPEPDQNWTSFIEWLANGSETYWITGKPGAGKSTLMKFINDDSRTSLHLRKWAKDMKLISASFYFWNSGTEIQMSNEGLLRSILFQILNKSPELISDIFPKRWESLNLFGFDSEPWTVAEYLRAFRLLSDKRFSYLRVFLLIDGLDEFVGEHAELINLVKEMVCCDHIKICVSSRPWVIFQEAFNRRPSLMLQDLTSHDISIYIRTKFEQSERFSHIQQRDLKFAEDLFREVASRSSGVFLWVYLVVQSLLEGISNGDRVSDLRQRLNDLPANLEDLFRKIMNNLEPRYKQHASELFQICRIYGSIPALRLSFADEENDSLWKDDRPVALTMEDFNFRLLEVKRRVDSRTRGLLEISGWSDFQKAIKKSTRSQGPVSKLARGDSTCVVQYLHRTVKDFVEQENNWSYLTEIAPNFDPYVSLCKAFVLEVKTFDFSTLTVQNLHQFTYKAMRYAFNAHTKSHHILISLLDSLNRLVSSLIIEENTTFGLLDRRVPKDHYMLFPIAIEIDLEFWVENLLDRGHPIVSP